MLLSEITLCVLNLIPTQARNIRITDVGGRHLLEAMQSNSTVTSFGSLVSMSPLIFRSSCVFVVSDCPFQPSLISDGLTRQISIRLVQNVLKHADCEHWHLVFACLQDDDVKDLLDALIEGKFTRLKEINLYNNALSDVSADRIAQALKTNDTVTEVVLVSCLSICLLLLQISSARMSQRDASLLCRALTKP